MEAIDKRDRFYELEEIYKYKDLISLSDKNVLKLAIYDGDDKCTSFYNEFLKLVAKEYDHQLNKAEFAPLKEKLIQEIQEYIDQKNIG